MKKSILIVASIIMAATITACGAGNINMAGQVVTSSAPAPEQDASSQVSQAPVAKNYEKNLSGLVQSMKDKNYITGEPFTMKASFIGAKEGVKYEAVLDKTKFNVELYEYDTAALDANAKKMIEEVKTTGKFTILASQPVPAVLSDNSKYLMVYGDTSELEANTARRQEVEALFKAYQ